MNFFTLCLPFDNSDSWESGHLNLGRLCFASPLENKISELFKKCHI